MSPLFLLCMLLMQIQLSSNITELERNSTEMEGKLQQLHNKLAESVRQVCVYLSRRPCASCKNYEVQLVKAHKTKTDLKVLFIALPLFDFAGATGTDCQPAGINDSGTLSSGLFFGESIY